MARLEDITVGASVFGIAGNKPVSVVAVKWHGSAVVKITYKDARSQLANELLYRTDEERLSVGKHSLPWSFGADANLLCLISEAYHINLAHIFDPYLAVHTSSIEPLPHQISAVYKKMLARLPLRYILADDPGAGKTIMTGFFLKELLVRGDLKFIEVKGRSAGQATVTVSKNEILTALDKPYEYILAIVKVNLSAEKESGAQTKTVYLKKPFCERPDFAATSVNYDIVKLVKESELILDRGER